MKILFRVDAGRKVGLGHIYRSITLARTLKLSGHDVIFSFAESGFWRQMIRKGFEFTVKPLREIDSEKITREYIKTENVDVYYVDAILDFSPGFIEHIRHHCRVVFYQNMSAAAPRADVFICPSICSDLSFFTHFGPSSLVYRGLEYIILNPDVAAIPKKQVFSDLIKTVAVSAGGSDPADTLRRIYSLVKTDSFKEFNFYFFYGVDYAFASGIPRRLPKNIVFKKFNHEAILKADILISAFGVSTYEFLWLNMPILTFGHQPNNAKAASALANATGALVDLGGIDTLNRRDLQKRLLNLVSRESRIEMTCRAANLIDLDGPQRVASIIDSIQCSRKE